MRERQSRQPGVVRTLAGDMKAFDQFEPPVQDIWGVANSSIVEVLPAQRFSRNSRPSTLWQPGHPITEGAGPLIGRQSLPKGVSLGNQAQALPFIFQPESRMRTSAQESSGDLEFAARVGFEDLRPSHDSHLQASTATV